MPYYRRSDGLPAHFAFFDGTRCISDGTEPLPAECLAYAEDLVECGDLEKSDKPFKKAKTPKPAAPAPAAPDPDPEPADDPGLALPQAVGPFKVDESAYNKATLVEAAKALGIDTKGTKAIVTKNLSEHADGDAVQAALAAASK